MKCRALLAFSISTFLFLSFASAQKITVKKTKGRNALVESTIPLEEGQVYDLQSTPIAENVNYKTIGLKSRQNSLMFGGSFSSLSSENYQKNQGSLHIRYGWNFTQLEFGADASFNTVDVGAGATSDFLLGGYFDYNLVTNRDPKPLIYGPFASAGFGSIQSPSSKGGGSTSIIDTNLGGFLTWFVNGGSSALRAEAYLDYQQINSSVKQTGVTGFGARGFLIFYF